MEFKGVDITPLMGIGGWAIDVIEKSIPNKVAYTYSEPHKAWFIWDFYPTAFLAPHTVIFSIFPEERFTPELAEEVIVKPWLEARFERFVLSMVIWFGLIDNSQENILEGLIPAILEDHKQEREADIKIPLLWTYPEGLEKGVYTFIAYETKGGEPIKPVSLDKVVLRMGTQLKEIPPELREESLNWTTFVWIKEKEGASYPSTLGLPLFFGNVVPIDKAFSIKEVMLENIAIYSENKPEYLKGVELLLMGTKWFDKFQELKKELEVVKV